MQPLQLQPNPPATLKITHTDLAHLLLNLTPTAPYIPSEPIFFQETPNSPWLPITSLQLRTGSSTYILTIHVPCTSHSYKDSYTSSPSIALPPTHPLLATAPLLPPYFFLPDQPFHTTTTATLTIPQTLHFLQLFTAPYQFPPETFRNWTSTTNITLARRWPTKETPFQTQLEITHSAQWNPTPSIFHLDTPNSPLTPAYSSLHQILLLGSLLPKLFANNPDNPPPWLLVGSVSDTADPALTTLYKLELFQVPSYASITPYDTLANNLIDRGVFLLPHPLQHTPPPLNTPLSSDRLTDLHVVPLDYLFSNSPPTHPTNATTLIQNTLHELKQLLHYVHNNLLNC